MMSWPPRSRRQASSRPNRPAPTTTMRWRARLSDTGIDLTAQLPELLGLLLHPGLDIHHPNGFRIGRVQVLPDSVFPYFSSDPHGAEPRPAHGTEVGHLGTLLGQGLVVEGAGPLGVQPQVELIDPAKLEARLAQGIVPQLGPRVDRKSTRLNSSHVAISYAVFCLKKKN